MEKQHRPVDVVTFSTCFTASLPLAWHCIALYAVISRHISVITSNKTRSFHQELNALYMWNKKATALFQLYTGISIQ